MTQVYGQTGANDTPILVPGWNVQNATTGTDENLTGHAGPQGGLVQTQAAPAPTAVAAGETTYTPAQITAMNADIAAIVTKLKAAGVFE